MQLDIKSAQAKKVDIIANADQNNKGVSNLLGWLLIKQGKISEQDVNRIYSFATKRNMRFGEAAVKLRLISNQDLDHAIAAQYEYPYLEKGAGGYSKKLVTAFDPVSAKGNALRILRSQLLQNWFSFGHRALAVIASGEREGCSYITANLAAIFSQLGESTLLIDANFKNPTQHRHFNVDNSVGLSAALVGRVAVESVIREVPLFRDLSLITAGVTPPNPYELLWRFELAEIVPRLSQKYNIILFDTPAFSENLGAETVAQQCGGALMVIRRDHTRLADARKLKRAINEVGAKVVGSAINQF